MSPAAAAATTAAAGGRAARNVAALVAAELVGKLAGVVLAVVAARALGDEGFGVFAFALSFSLLLATVPVGGFTTLLVQRASLAPAQLDRMLTEALAINTALAVPVYLVVGGAVAAFRPTAEAATAVVVLLVASLFEVWATTLRSAAQARQQQGGVALALVVQRLGTTVLACLVLALGGGVVGLSVAYLAGTLLGGCAVAAAVRRLGVRLDRTGIRPAQAWRTVRDAFPLSVDSVVSMALFRLDVVLLGLLATDAAVGHYSAAYRLLETVLFLTWTLNSALFPAVSADPTPQRVRAGLVQGLSVAAAAYVPFAVLMLLRPADLLSLLYGSSYAAPGAPVLRWLSLAPLCFALAYFASYALLALEQRTRVLAASLLAAGANVAANLLLIPAFSAVGAAAATTGCYLLEAVVLVAWLRSRAGSRARDLLRPLRVPVLAALPFTALLLVPLPVLLSLALAAPVYAASWLLLARRVEPEMVLVLRRLVRRA